MIYKRFFDTKEFCDSTYSILLQHEAQNTLPLGNIILGNQGGEETGWKNIKNWYMATVSDNFGKILLVAIMTPPFNITMYETNNIRNDEALNCLCDNLIKENIHVPGVTSENNLANRFAKLYTEKKNMEYSVHKNMRIYVVDQVNKESLLVGRLRKAEMKDLYYLPYWHNAFYDECDLIKQNLYDAYVSREGAINQEVQFVLEDEGMPVSIASTSRKVVTGRSVGMVYTPPYFRNRGYASSCVAQVSQKVLDMGYKYVSLFTDLSNPTSNSIYKKIGYKPICDYQEIQFKNFK